MGEGLADGVKRRLRASGSRSFDERMAAAGGAAENKNPDDAAVENIDIGVALT